MLTASSPVAYPPSSSPPTNKRTAPVKDSKRRARTGFVQDDNDSDEEYGSEQPAAKRRMLSSPRELNAADNTEPSSPPDLPKDQPVIADEQPFASQEDSQDNQASNQDLMVDALLNSSSNFASAFDKLASRQSRGKYNITTSSGATVNLPQRLTTSAASYQSLVASRSKTKEGRAKRSYFGIEIHELVASAKRDIADKAKATAPAAKQSDHAVPSIEKVVPPKRTKKTLLWTEKYRAKNFMDLCGDDGTNRNVLRWLKRWDPVVFPRAARPKSAVRRPGVQTQVEEDKPLRRILMLTGPPGLGKTTLAHVCARQAGYDVMEINASDDRGREVVKNQIRTSLGTESVKTVQHGKSPTTNQPKMARPVCVVVDEVDGVVTGSGGSGEGGFIKALMDLITLGEKNISGYEASNQQGRRRKKGDDFRQMRPLILICNDVYHPSLRPLRQSSLAEVIHVGKPTIDAVVTRLKTVFEKEGIPCEKDAARKLCEAAWGMSGGIEAKRGAESTAEGDLRGIMVVGEWVAGRLRAASLSDSLCLTRHWVEKNIVHELAHGGGGARGIGRGNVKDIVSRIFQEGAGFPKSNIVVTKDAAPAGEQPKTQLGFSEQHKKYAMERLRHMIETSGDVDRIVTDIFSDYPNHDFNDDSFLSKPDQAYEWLNFHDTCSSRLFGSQDWELAPYLSQPALACHHLFAGPLRRSHLMYQSKGHVEEAEAAPLPFSGPRADFSAYEAEKTNRAMLQSIQAQLSPTLMRSFRSAEDISTDFMPYLIRLVSPDVKPVVVGGSGDQKGMASVRKESEKRMVKRAAETMLDIGVTLQRGKIETDPATSRGPTWVYRMEPDIDALASFETSAAIVHGTQAPTRYAVRQVVDQEIQKVRTLRDNSARQSRFKAGNLLVHEEYTFDDKENSAPKLSDASLPAVPIKRDFFGRVIKEVVQPLGETSGNSSGGGEKRMAGDDDAGKSGTKIWVTFHEGLNNAVKKPISLQELLRGL